jgi:hypothetical protein
VLLPEAGLKGSLFQEHIVLRPLLKAKGLANLKFFFVHVGKRRIKKGRLLQVGSSFPSSSRDWRSSWVAASWVKMYFNLSHLYSF